jgi:DNA-binding transcriptional LysR family regulator
MLGSTSASRLRDLERLAPNAALTVTAWNERSYDDLASGRLDVAIMSADNPPGTLQCERLFTEEYVCMVAADHPVRGRRLSLDTYLAYRHAVIDIMNGSQPSIDQPLAGQRMRRRVGYLTPFLGSAAFAVARTSMILTAPRRLAERYRSFVPVRILAPPREIGDFAYSLLWHKRLETSLAHAWLRARIKELAKEVFSKSRVSA